MSFEAAHTGEKKNETLYKGLSIHRNQVVAARVGLLGVARRGRFTASLNLNSSHTYMHSPSAFPIPSSGNRILFVACNNHHSISISSNFVIACSPEPWLSRYAVPPAASRAKARPSNCSIFQLPNWPVQRLWLFADWAVGLRESRLHLRSKICMDSR
jgi:hypothetical protein